LPSDNEDIAEYLASRGAVIDQTDTNKGAEVRPCSGNLIQKYDINPPVKVICFTEADGRLWGGCTDGSVLVWSLQVRCFIFFKKKIKIRIYSL